MKMTIDSKDTPEYITCQHEKTKCCGCVFNKTCELKPGYSKEIVEFEKKIDEWDRKVSGIDSDDIVTDEGLDNSRYMIQDQYNSFYK